MLKAGDTFNLQTGKVVLVLNDGITAEDFNSEYDHKITTWLNITTGSWTKLLVNNPDDGTYFYQPLPGDVCYNVMIGDEIGWVRENMLEWCKRK